MNAKSLGTQRGVTSRTMPSEVPAPPLRDVIEVSKSLQTRGYAFIAEWRCEATTLDIANAVGAAVNASVITPSSRVPTVQTLRPRRESEALPNRYSGTFGLGTFPLHTDLAHWALPPRYLILRCIRGGPAVLTTLLPRAAFEAAVGRASLRRAIVRPRRAEAGKPLCAFPLLFSRDGATGIRWDSMFVLPITKAAREVAEAMRVRTCDGSHFVSLSRPADTLIVDNWACLHGRGAVEAMDTVRELERVYLSRTYS